MRNGIYTDAELSAYAQAWDMESAAKEVELGRIADAYEAGMLVPAMEAATVPLSAFLIMCVVAAVLVGAILLVG